MGSLLYTAERKEKTHPKPTPLIEEMSESNKKIGDTYSSRDVSVCIDSPVGSSLIQSLFGIMKVRAIQLSGCPHVIGYSWQTSCSCRVSHPRLVSLIYIKIREKSKFEKKSVNNGNLAIWLKCFKTMQLENTQG